MVGRRFRDLDGLVLATDDAGHFRLEPGAEWASQDRGSLVPLPSGPHPSRAELRLAELVQEFAGAARRWIPDQLEYLILVPTLRCNLACSYCQVSRAAMDAPGYDWSAETLDAVLDLVGGLDALAIKIEFQGGEPTLRPDLIRAVIDRVPQGVDASFVICSNLQQLDDEILAIFDRPDVSISTSLDGPAWLHARQRQGDPEKGEVFFRNLDRLLERYGPSKISALPTIDPRSPPDPDQLIDAFAERGLNAIFLRPINYQGFARKRHAGSLETGAGWTAYHQRFIARLIERNYTDRSRVLEETSFSLHLRRIFRPGSNRHVDLRNPSPVGRDYVVIDHDGKAYPSDEARMLARSRVIDLSIGDIFGGWDTPAREALDAVSTLDGDPACEGCAYKPYCGRDIYDDISRYGTIDVPRHETEFCRRHLSLFDFAFRMIHSNDETVRYSLARWLNLPGEFPRLGGQS